MNYGTVISVQAVYLQTIAWGDVAFFTQNLRKMFILNYSNSTIIVFSLLMEVVIFPLWFESWKFINTAFMWMKKKKKFLFDVSVKFNINANYYIFKKYSSLNKINGCNKIKKML